MPPYTRTALLSHALVGYQERKQQIDEAITRIQGMLDGKRGSIAAGSSVQPAARKRRTMSPAARKRMALMMKRRWAKAGRKRLA